MANPAPLNSEGALLRCQDLALRRGGRLLFDGLNLTVQPGERVVLTGPNGAGKSSLLRAIAGLLQPEHGRVDTVQVALADDAPALDRERPLLAALDFWVGPATEARHRLAAALTALDLAMLVPVPVRLLSAGQLKRATLIRVVASTAPLWLLDEPTNGLDGQGFDDLFGLIEKHVSQGGAVISASHISLPGEWRQVELGA